MEGIVFLEKLKAAQSIFTAISDCQKKLNVCMSRAIKYEDEFTDKKKMTWKEALGGGVFFAIVGIFFGGIIGVIVGFILGILLVTIVEMFDAKKRSAKADEYYEKNVIPLLGKAEIIVKELDSLWKSDEYREAQELMPQNYISVSAIDWMVKAVETKRADSLKEVINLYEDMLHKERQISITQGTPNVQNESILIAKFHESCARQIAECADKSARPDKYANILQIVNTAHN